MKLSDGLLKNKVYEIAKPNTSIDKYRFYKAILLSQLVYVDCNRIKEARNYLRLVIDQDTLSGPAIFELLILNRDLILCQYLALKTIENERD